MTSKEALKNIREFKPYGYDNDYKEEYALDGTLNDYLQEEVDIIEKDLEVLSILKKLFIPTNDYESTYYDLGNGIMTVDSLINLSVDEIKLIEGWLEDEKESIYN